MDEYDSFTCWHGLWMVVALLVVGLIAQAVSKDRP